MMMNTAINHLRNTTLALGVLAVVPMAAQAMLATHDTENIDATSASNTVKGSTVIKQLSADADIVLEARFGTYAGIPGKGSSQVSVEQFSVEPKGRSTNGSSEPTRWLP